MFPAPPALFHKPPIVTAKTEQPRKQLTSVYRNTDNNLYEIDCSYSPCRNKCIFRHPESGFVVFDRTKEIMLASETNISTHYLQYLQRALKQWKQQFDDFDLQ